MKLVIFDFDGTLVDSRRLIVESHRIVFGEFGLTPPTEDESLALIGMSLEIVLARLAGADATVQDMAEAYRRLLPALRSDPAFAERPFEGAGELLETLATRDDVRLGIATGHVSHAIAPVLDHLDWRKFFCTVQTADKAPSKPHPAMLLQAIDAAGVSAAQTIMIGDTAFDMEMATAAGVYGVAVAWGYHSPVRLTAAGAACVAGQMDDLRKHLLSRLD